MAVPSKIKNFYKRWNIPITFDENKFNEFKNRILNIVCEDLGDNIKDNTSFAKEYLQLIGEKWNYTLFTPYGSWNYTPLTSLDLADTLVFESFEKETNFNKFIFKIQAIFWCESLYDFTKEILFRDIKDAIEISLIPIELKKTQMGYLFYPSGAKLLDEKLVNDVLDWLEDYPEVYKHFSLALSQFMNGGPLRNILDNLRLSLEQLTKEILNNNKSLEKQKEELLRFLDSKGIQQEIINLYYTLLSQYTKFQNENVKHKENLSGKEIEFIIYLTGIFMRLLLQLREA